MKLFILAIYNKPSLSDKTKTIQESRILDTYFNIRGGGTVKEEILRMQKELTLDEVTKFLQKRYRQAELVSFQVVAKPRTRWVSGEYYAHEHSQYVKGRARLIKWSETYQELEVECLDKSLPVSDGIWNYETSVSGRQSNGCGDEFYPDKAIK